MKAILASKCINCCEKYTGKAIFVELHNGKVIWWHPTHYKQQSCFNLKYDKYKILKKELRNKKQPYEVARISFKDFCNYDMEKFINSGGKIKEVVK